MEQEARDHESRSQSFGWQVAVGVIVALGCLATAAYAGVETFWG